MSVVIYTEAVYKICYIILRPLPDLTRVETKSTHPFLCHHLAVYYTALVEDALIGNYLLLRNMQSVLAWKVRSDVAIVDQLGTISRARLHNSTLHIHIQQQSFLV